MKNYLFFALLLVFMAGCQKERNAPAQSQDGLIGYWKYDGHGEEGERFYSAVPSDEGFTIPEKSLMMEFRPDGFFRQFFWNWCATPPAMPSDWQNGGWERISEQPPIIRLRIGDSSEASFQDFEILEIDETHLVIK